MTENQVENLQENKPNDKELNFRALEAKYKRELEQERSARIEAERLTQQALERNQEEEEVNSDPYVDDKRLDKKLARFGQSTQSEIQKAMEIAKHAAKE